MKNVKSIFSDKNIQTGIRLARQSDIVHFRPPINAAFIFVHYFVFQSEQKINIARRNRQSSKLST